MNNKTNNINVKLWNNIAIVAAIFAFIISVLLIANYLQINRIDPVNTEIINALVQRLSENPMDDKLRAQIREMDLLARKAYFTNRWQIKTGGYLLIFSIGLIVLSMQMITINTKPKPILEEINENENSFILKKKGRKLISAFGGFFVVIALILAFLSNKQLESSYRDAAEKAILSEEKEESLINLLIDSTVNVKETSVKEDSSLVTVASEFNEAVPAKSLQDNGVKPENTKMERVKASFPSINELKKNFPGFRGVNGNGIAYQKNIPVNWDGETGENIRWKSKIPLSGFNSPIIWGNRVFVSGADALKRQVYCFNADNGQLTWTFNVEGIEGSPEKSLDVSHDTGHAAASLATDGKNVYAIFANGDIVAIKMEGNKSWAKNLGVPSNHYGHSSSLIIFEDLLIVQYDHKASAQILALDTKSGEEVWRTKRQVKVSWASPILINANGRPEIILVADPLVASYDPITGKELWALKCMSGEVGPSAAYFDGVVYALNEYASLVALQINENKTEILWEDFNYLSDVPSPVAHNGLLFVATSYGLVACLDAKTGELYWEQEMGNGIYASPIIADNKVYLIDNVGTMHIFKAEKQFTSIANPELGENTVCTPAFKDGRIYIRTDNNLICIGVEQ